MGAGAGLGLKQLEKTRKYHSDVANTIYQDQFGRDATSEETAGVAKFVQQNLGSNQEVSDSSSTVWGYYPAASGVSVADSVKNATSAVWSSDTFKKSAKVEINKKIDVEITEQFGITDQAQIDKIKKGFSSFDTILKSADAGTGVKSSMGKISSAVDYVDTQRNTAVELIYAGEYGKALKGDISKQRENMDEYLDSIAGTDFGLDYLVETDPKKNRDTGKVMAGDVSAFIDADESIQAVRAEQAAEEEAATPYDAETVTAKLNEARDKLADDLASAEGNRAEALQTAYQEYVDTIPGDIEKVREIAEERLAERMEKLPEQFGEFGARLGLGVGQSGQLQQALAEETAKAGEETERGLQEYQLGREQEAAGMKLNLEQQIADYAARRETGIAQLGYGIEELGTQIGRQDWQTLLAQQYQQAQTANQQEYNTFLTQMGYQQNQIAQQQQFNQQLGMLYQQQGFQAQQGELDRQLQERLFNRQVEIAEQQRSRARKQQKRGAMQSLIGAGIGAAAGGFFSPAGMMLGAGILGGQPGLASAGAYTIGEGRKNPWLWGIN